MIQLIDKVARQDALMKVEAFFQHEIRPLFGDETVKRSAKFHLISGYVELRQKVKHGHLDNARVQYRALSEFKNNLKTERGLIHEQ